MTEHKLIQLQAVYVTDEFIMLPETWPEWFDGHVSAPSALSLAVDTKDGFVGACSRDWIVREDDGSLTVSWYTNDVAENGPSLVIHDKGRLFRAVIDE